LAKFLFLGILLLAEPLRLPFLSKEGNRVYLSFLFPFKLLEGTARMLGTAGSTNHLSDKSLFSSSDLSLSSSDLSLSSSD